MLKLDINKEKTLEFSVSLVGRFSGEISSFFRIYFENFNIGFPAKISNYELIKIKLPKLAQYITAEFPEKAYATLEIIQDRDMFLAWRDDVKFKQTDIQAKLEDEEEEEKEIKVKAVLKSDGDDIEVEVPRTKNKPTQKKEQVVPNSNILNLTEAFKNGIKKIEVSDTRDFAKKIQEKKIKLEKTQTALKIQDIFKKNADLD